MDVEARGAQEPVPPARLPLCSRVVIVSGVGGEGVEVQSMVGDGGMCEFVMCLFWDRKKQETGAEIAVQRSPLHSAVRARAYTPTRAL